MFQEDNDDLYLEPTAGKLHRTSQELALTCWLWESDISSYLDCNIYNCSMLLSLHSSPSWADEDASISQDRTCTFSYTHVSALDQSTVICTKAEVTCDITCLHSNQKCNQIANVAHIVVALCSEFLLMNIRWKSTFFLLAGWSLQFPELSLWVCLLISALSLIISLC